jgi:hypothetical protein
LSSHVLCKIGVLDAQYTIAKDSYTELVIVARTACNLDCLACHIQSKLVL